MNTSIDTRAKSVSDVFKASPSSVFEFFAKAGQGLYVPAYQRPYSWDKANINRLVEDVSHGFKMLVSQPDTVTFLGTIIAIHDTQHKTVSPLVRGKVPSRVMTIIDGQQRLTTLLIVVTILHEQLRTASKKLKATNTVDSWLAQEIQRQIAELQSTFEADQMYGDGHFRYYPRMIRSFDDQWSTDKQAIYKSPLAWYLHKYGEHVRSTEIPVKKFSLTSPSGIDEQLTNAHEAFQERVRAAQKSIRMLDEAKPNDEEGIEVPRWNDIVNSKPFQQALLNQTEIPEYVCAILQSETNPSYLQTLRTLLFSRFLLTRVGLTVVEATNEDSAFDLFEALNTTGEPLTAYETFKPKVIQNTTLEQFLQSKSKGFLSQIDEYLSQFTKTDEKQEATRNLVVSFALAETGEKLSRHLSEQRRFLRDRFEVLSADSDKVSFVEHFARCATFYKLAWPSTENASPTFGDFDSSMSDLARIGIDFLRQSKHTITVAPLIRFFAVAETAKMEGDVSRQKQAVRDLEDAIKAIAAFWALWRGSRQGTDGIDSYYRSMMQSPPQNGNEEEHKLVARFASLARRPSKSRTSIEPNIKSLKSALRTILREFGGIDSKATWVQRTANQPAYKAQAVTRFLLLSAFHDSPADMAHPGLNEKGTTGSVSLFSFAVWRSLSTIEHIAPQKPEVNSDWPSELYSDSSGELVDSLGNLTLLPQGINSSISNRSWKSKRFLYQVLSTPTEQGMKEKLSQAQAFAVGQPTAQLIEKKSTYMAQVEALGKVEGDWTRALVNQRGHRLAELCWDKLNAWLED